MPSICRLWFSGMKLPQVRARRARPSRASCGLIVRIHGETRVMKCSIPELTLPILTRPSDRWGKLPVGKEKWSSVRGATRLGAARAVQRHML